VVGEPNEAGALTVVAGLQSRTGKRVWHREREQFTFSRTIVVSALAEALDEALAAIPSLGRSRRPHTHLCVAFSLRARRLTSR
jgi:hypothetical protein